MHIVSIDINYRIQLYVVISNFTLLLNMKNQNSELMSTEMIGHIRNVTDMVRIPIVYGT